VLRFDYFGCGDSSGDATECRISRWIEDVSEAISEAQSRTGLQEVCLVGLRLGAALSLLTAARRSNVKAVVLWDPVVRGKEHLEGLIALNRELLRFRPKPQKQEADWPKDIIGFPIGRGLYEDIDQIDLLTIQEKPASSVLIVETEDNPSVIGLKGLLESMGVSVTFQHAHAPQVWLPTVDGGLQVPMSVLQFVVSWLDRTCP
jgi:pimeloyl-ACP methyl ester carboxylesterase